MPGLWYNRSITEVNYVLNNELKQMTIWFKVNKLSLNVNKTNHMCFHNKLYQDHCKLKIDGLEVSRLQVTKFLGVLVDEKWLWSNHTNVCKHFLNFFSVIYKVKQLLENNHLYILYCSLIILYLNYPYDIWGNTYKSQLHTLMLLPKESNL